MYALMVNPLLLKHILKVHAESPHPILASFDLHFSKVRNLGYETYDYDSYIQDEIVE